MRSKIRWFTDRCVWEGEDTNASKKDELVPSKTIHSVGWISNDPSAGSTNFPRHLDGEPSESHSPNASPDHSIGPYYLSRLRSRSLTELTRQITPPTKNGHAPPPIESRKSSQSVNHTYVWTCKFPVLSQIKPQAPRLVVPLPSIPLSFSLATILPPNPKTLISHKVLVKSSINIHQSLVGIVYG
ncbi:unnamed protein product [Bathycoccus prasinos]